MQEYGLSPKMSNTPNSISGREMLDIDSHRIVQGLSRYLYNTAKGLNPQAAKLLQKLHDSGQDATEAVRPSFLEIEQGQGTKIVSEGEEGIIISRSDSEPMKRIATPFLAGCIGVGVALESPDGLQKGYIRHFGLFESRPAGKLWSALYPQTRDNKHIAAHVVIMAPGWFQDTQEGSKMEPQELSLVKHLGATMQKELGPKADIQIYPYSGIFRPDGGREQGTLAIELDYGKQTIFVESIPTKPSIA